ncbi:phosphoribosylglycinamide formyltransferase [Helicobacter cappadocius]|uniref:Phosphoribosylglycinamide formyltransferase n=1 Tax=Helicobacter cappadocius TaxID=3063998 RepID=A0AA90PWA7_9HELI|nr:MULTISPECIES: phosphoribosylglycinamide formyltransferase [unclassified Helicobacter]MDO7253557.1 phosphoribosylglycinamide formyltransferase [Helicobacter sp. faydin-H75]MDP2539485.1 phosphoribosylglycinamide formyltransferase [Helicobacter sp. faydin-H76]
MKNINLVILFSGNGSNMENLINSLHSQEYFLKDTQEKAKIQISCAVTNNPNAYGISRCEALGINCEILPHKDFDCREDFDVALIDLLKNYQPDAVILAGFMRILSPIFTSTIRSINIHPSLLPKHKGSNAIKDTYESDDEFGGVSVHWVNEILDGGEIILQDYIPKIAGESLEEFENRIHQLEYALYPNAILKALNLTQVIKNG